MKIISLLILCLLMGVRLQADLQPEETPIETLTPSSEAMVLVHEGDALFALRTPTSGAESALAAYEKALQKDPQLWEAYWRISRASHWMGDHTLDKKIKMASFEKGMEAAKKAIQIEPRAVEPHFWLGANYGSYGEVKGVLKSLALVKPIRQEMETVIRLNDQFQGGAGYRVLGVVDTKVPGFAGGNKKRALENLNKALAIDPSNGFNRYYMAEYYSSVGERYKALDELAEIEKLTPTPDVDAPDLKSLQQKAKVLKKRLS